MHVKKGETLALPLSFTLYYTYYDSPTREHKNEEKEKDSIDEEKEHKYMRLIFVHRTFLVD
jgi:hypothetical protein